MNTGKPRLSLFASRARSVTSENFNGDGSAVDNIQQARWESSLSSGLAAAVRRGSADGAGGLHSSHSPPSLITPAAAHPIAPKRRGTVGESGVSYKYVDASGRGDSVGGDRATAAAAASKPHRSGSRVHAESSKDIMLQGEVKVWCEYFNNIIKCWEPLMEQVVATILYEEVLCTFYFIKRLSE